MTGSVTGSGYEPGCRQLTSKFSLHYESNKDQCLNRPYQTRKSQQIGVFLIFLSEIFLQDGVIEARCPASTVNDLDYESGE